MTTTVDTGAGQLAVDFAEQGFVHVPGLLTEPEVTRFRAAALDAVQQRSETDEDFGTAIHVRHRRLGTPPDAA